MNMHNRELAEQAGFYFYDLHDVDGQDLGESVEADSWSAVDKFAASIVDQCFQIIDREIDRLCEYQKSLPDWDGNRRDDCDLAIDKCLDLAQALKQHFGIEE